MPRPRRSLTGVLGLFAILALLFSGGRAVPKVDAVAKDAAYENLQVFTNILAIVQKNYVDDVSTKQLVEGAINGMLTSLDPHSAYLTPDLYKELQVDTKGSFGGLGIEITYRNGVLTVVSPIEDTPAYRAGHQGGRHDHQDRRRVHQGHDAGRGGEEDARPEGHARSCSRSSAKA